jgi:hypothetical protein
MFGLDDMQKRKCLTCRHPNRPAVGCRNRTRSVTTFAYFCRHYNSCSLELHSLCFNASSQMSVPSISINLSRNVICRLVSTGCRFQSFENYGIECSQFLIYRLNNYRRYASCNWRYARGLTCSVLFAEIGNIIQPRTFIDLPYIKIFSQKYTKLKIIPGTRP